MSSVLFNSFHLSKFALVSNTFVHFFHGTLDGTMCPEVDSAFESEYQGFLLG